MTVQKTPDAPGEFDRERVHWEEDLRPFRRLPRAPRPNTQQPVPAIIPMLVSFALVSAACVGAVLFLNANRPALTVVLPTATPRIITPTPTPYIPPTATPYIAPTATPEPTATPAPSPTQFGVGARVVIVNTGGGGLNFRRKPGLSGELIRRLPEGTTYEIVGGPEQVDGFIWWQLRDPTDGTIGWGVQNYMQLVP
ncbi:MAG: SH3 domain-containing protein [Thermoflexales bacterium]|nr:SH3 domain-containing protein [Thermoflexales bacterium]